MPMPVRKRFAITAMCVVAALAVGWQVLRAMPTAREGRIDSATLTSLDAATGQAEIEFVHPRSGRLMRLTGSLAGGAQIRVDGQPAELRSLRVGDRLSVRGMLHANRTVVAHEVDVVRSPATAEAAAQ